MSATLTLHQERTNEPDGTYKIVNTVLDSVGIPPEVFVMDKDTGAFNHVANVFEFTTLSTDPVTSPLAYRDSVAEAVYFDVATAIAFAEDIKRRVDLLIEEYTPEVEAFQGEEDIDFPLP